MSEAIKGLRERLLERLLEKGWLEDIVAFNVVEHLMPLVESALADERAKREKLAAMLLEYAQGFHSHTQQHPGKFEQCDDDDCSEARALLADVKGDA